MVRALNLMMSVFSYWLLVEGRMSCHISIREMTPFHVGALMYFFFLTIAYEGAMENINAFDQPGVEDYKKILHGDLRNYIIHEQDKKLV